MHSMMIVSAHRCSASCRCGQVNVFVSGREEAHGNGVVPAISLVTHADDRSESAQSIVVLVAGVWTAAIRVGQFWPDSGPRFIHRIVLVSTRVHSPRRDRISVTEAQLSLDSAIATLDLSARVRALLEKKNLQTLREAVALDPRALVEEKNFGRKSLVELRAVIERAAGKPWESARDALFDAAPSPSEDHPLPAATPLRWNDVRPWLSAPLAATPLESVRDLPARVRAFAESKGITTLGELFAIPASQLVDEPNLGRKSLADAVSLAIELHQSQSTAPRTLRSFDSFAALFLSALAPLRQIERMVVAGRAGVTEAPATLVELGDMLGVSRERARQLEARAINELLRDRWWIDVLDATLYDLTRDALLTLDEVAERDPWLRTAFTVSSVFDFVCDRLLDGRFHRVIVDDVVYLAQCAQELLDARWSSLSAVLSARVPVRARRDQRRGERSVSRSRRRRSRALQRACPGVAEGRRRTRRWLW